MLRTPLGRLRAIGLVEGVSFLLLIGIAMPLKYYADWPLGVTVVGGAHGLLWMLYLVAIAWVWVTEKWGIGRVLLAGVASVVPGGPFFMEPSLRREDERKRNAEHADQSRADEEDQILLDPR